MWVADHQWLLHSPLLYLSVLHSPLLYFPVLHSPLTVIFRDKSSFVLWSTLTYMFGPRSTETVGKIAENMISFTVFCALEKVSSQSNKGASKTSCHGKSHCFASFSMAGIPAAWNLPLHYWQHQSVCVHTRFPVEIINYNEEKLAK